jgi:hypothetical protein
MDETMAVDVFLLTSVKLLYKVRLQRRAANEILNKIH